MIELENDTLRFRFPGIHRDAHCEVSFFRTLRIPDDNRKYPLPPGFSTFPLKHVDDYANSAPEAWSRHGGVFMPMHQAEAMWISFSGRYPMALKIAAGKVSALTGEPWQNDLSASPDQDYLVIPDQPWLDGFFAGKGLIRQFVAMPLGEGYTAEEQLTGRAEHGGLQIVAYPMKAAEYERLNRRETYFEESVLMCAVMDDKREMGLAPGGMMRQEIYEDPHDFNVWDRSESSRCFVHILNSLQYFSVTNERPPTRPPTAKQYTDAGLPWFDYYDADRKALASTTKLSKLKSVATMKSKQRRDDLTDNEPVSPEKVIKLSKHGPAVREGDF